MASSICLKCKIKPVSRRAMCVECNALYGKNQRIRLYDRYIKMKQTQKEKNDGVSVNLSFLQFCATHAYGFCFYCDGPLPPQGKGLDRKKVGNYSWDNVLPCCGQTGFKLEGGNCNRIKGVSLTVFETWSIQVRRQRGEWPLEHEFENHFGQFELIRSSYYDTLQDLTSGQIEGLKKATDVQEYIVSLRLGE
jgi:hypothetical protein